MHVLGYYATEKEAAQIVDEVATKTFGGRAKRNFPLAGMSEQPSLDDDPTAKNEAKKPSKRKGMSFKKRLEARSRK